MHVPGKQGTSAQPQHVEHQRGSTGKKTRHILTTAHKLGMAATPSITWKLWRRAMAHGHTSRLIPGCMQAAQAPTDSKAPFNAATGGPAGASPQVCMQSASAQLLSNKPSFVPNVLLACLRHELESISASAAFAWMCSLHAFSISLEGRQHAHPFPQVYCLHAFGIPHCPPSQHSLCSFRHD